MLGKAYVRIVSSQKRGEAQWEKTRQDGVSEAESGSRTILY